jgi:PilZ domain-containing protein
MQRRSKRLRLVIPVEVLAFEGETQLFRESAQVQCVSAHGGLVVLNAEVTVGQTLRIINRRTHEHQDCRIVNVEPTEDNKFAAGVEFIRPAGNFWQISFPPVNPRFVVASQN